MWVVIADNGDETWAYGVFIDKKQATKFCDKIQSKNPEIEYSVADFLGTTGAFDDETTEKSHDPSC